MVTDGGMAKASVHHDSQSKDGAGSGKGSETVCFLGAESNPRGFLTAGSSEFDSDKRLFRGRGGEGEKSWSVRVLDGEGERGALEVCSGDSILNGIKRHYFAFYNGDFYSQTTFARRRGWMGP